MFSLWTEYFVLHWYRMQCRAPTWIRPFRRRIRATGSVFRPYLPVPSIGLSQQTERPPQGSWLQQDPNSLQPIWKSTPAIKSTLIFVTKRKKCDLPYWKWRHWCRWTVAKSSKRAKQRLVSTRRRQSSVSGSGSSSSSSSKSIPLLPHLYKMKRSIPEFRFDRVNSIPRFSCVKISGMIQVRGMLVELSVNISTIWLC